MVSCWQPAFSLMMTTWKTVRRVGTSKSEISLHFFVENDFQVIRQFHLYNFLLCFSDQGRIEIFSLAIIIFGICIDHDDLYMICMIWTTGQLWKRGWWFESISWSVESDNMILWEKHLTSYHDRSRWIVVDWPKTRTATQIATHSHILLGNNNIPVIPSACHEKLKMYYLIGHKQASVTHNITRRMVSWGFRSTRSIAKNQPRHPGI